MTLSITSTITLENGVEMPVFGLGTYKSEPGEQVRHAVESALRVGYRSIDTASLYANEEGIGEGVRASGVPREEVFLTTKVWNTQQGYDGTRAALEESLGKLGTDHVDLYLVHWPIEVHIEGTWKAMESLLEQGMTRAIGVCNHLPHHLQALLSHATVAPMVDQVEFHPYLQQPGLQAFAAEHDIVLEAWAPIMRGAVDDVPELVRIAAAHGKSPAQVAIRWALQVGAVVIPKSVHDDRIAHNADVFDFELSDSEMDLIDTLDRAQRIGPDPDEYAWKQERA